MRVYFTLACVCVASVALANSPEPQEAVSLFEAYLTHEEVEGAADQPVHVRSSANEKGSVFTDITLLDVDFPSVMRVQEVAKRILYSDVDVVHLTNTSTEDAAHLYEMLERSYAHFIHVPSQGKGTLVASKYPLSQPSVKLTKHKKASRKDLLEFAIHGANTYQARLPLGSRSMQVVGPDEEQNHETASVSLVGLPGTLTVVRQDFVPGRVAEKANLVGQNTIQIVPVFEVDGTLTFSTDGNNSRFDVRVGGSDNRGNRVDVEARINSDGTKDVSVGVSHDPDRAE